MKSMKFLVKGSVIALFALVTACASTSDPSEAYKGQTGEQIFKGGESSLRDRSYGDAIKHFEALDVQYPFGPNTEIAQLHIIYAYYMNSDFPSAEAAADRFIHANPTSSHVDYAYYMRGLSNYYQNIGIFEKVFTVDFATRDLSQIKKSFADFSSIVQQYPASPYAPAAHQYMVYLRNVIANHELEISQYYYQHRAYVASANRASLVVKNYQGAPVVPDALVMMAKSYHQLHLTQSEKETIDVISYNYPNSIYLKQVTGDQANSPKLMIAPRQQSPVIPKEKAEATLPPEPLQVSSNVVTSKASNEVAQSNGTRGKTPVTLTEIFTSLDKQVKNSKVYSTSVASNKSTPQHREIAPLAQQPEQTVVASSQDTKKKAITPAQENVVVPAILKPAPVTTRSYHMNGTR